MALKFISIYFLFLIGWSSVFKAIFYVFFNSLIANYDVSVFEVYFSCFFNGDNLCFFFAIKFRFKCGSDLKVPKLFYMLLWIFTVSY